MNTVLVRLLWLVLGCAVFYVACRATRPLTSPRWRRILRTFIFAFIFLPIVYLGHPPIFQPLWYAVFSDPGFLVYAVCYWVGFVVVVEIICTVINFFREE